MPLGRNVEVVEVRSGNVFSNILKAIGALVLVGFVALIGLILVSAYFAHKVVDSPAQTRAALPATDAKPPTAPAASPRIAGPGEFVHVGYWTYRINRAGWTQALPGQSLLEHADAQYLVLDITARNDDNTPSTLPTVELVDESGRLSRSSADASLEPGVFSVFKELNPGVESQGYVIFDVDPNRHYRAAFSGGYKSGERALAEIPFKSDVKNTESAAPLQ